MAAPSRTPLAVCVRLCSRMANSGVISYSDLKSLVGRDKGLVLVDVRNKDEVDKGRIPGSIHIPLSDVERDLSLDPDAFQTKFGVAKPPLDTPNLVFHCQLGRRGQAATDKAKSLGFENARNYVGAYKEWSEKEGK
ncbi:thiosulfate:glutathione sulfurtransferase [Astyanax mexicanus]|uniref:thiosulfate:glutathione sulfurtransferase n=1 Tax=Astyanax mexicanus TaxID=7994 RepID=UPI0020CB064E|nr:thiosulfate:glutathione sulfurtransferase [Astyanax mexicanus]